MTAHVKVSVSIPARLHERITQRAAAMRLPVSRVYALACSAYLRDPDADAALAALERLWR